MEKKKIKALTLPTQGRGVQRHFSEDQVIEIIEAYNKGTPIKDLAVKYEIKEANLAKIFTNYLIAEEEMTAFQKNKIRYLQKVQQKILNELLWNDEKLAKANYRDLSISLGVLADKERHEKINVLAETGTNFFTHMLAEYSGRRLQKDGLKHAGTIIDARSTPNKQKGLKQSEDARTLKRKAKQEQQAIEHRRKRRDDQRLYRARRAREADER